MKAPQSPAIPAVLAASAAYAAILTLPHGWLAAPLAAGALAAALTRRPRTAALAGAAAGAAGITLYILAAGLHEALGLYLAIAGPTPALLGLAYHPTATALAGYLACQAAAKPRSRGARPEDKAGGPEDT